MVSRYANRRAAARGVVLIEALIGILIFSIGVLGLVGLQASMTRAQTSTKVRADAVLLANEVVGIMWADREADHPKYTDASCSKHAPCKAWLDKVRRSLPAGDASIAYTQTDARQVQVVVSWSMPNEGAHRYEMLGVVAP